MSDIYPVLDRCKTRAYLDKEAYQALYEHSINAPQAFWALQAGIHLDFHTPYSSVFEGDFKHQAWFKGGRLNASYQCIDRHLPTHADKTAIIFEGDEPGETTTLTYQALHDAVCQMANQLKILGIKPHDSVCIYLPMCLELAISMLACARIGAIHSVVFAGFSPESLKQRMEAAKAKVLISCQHAKRGGKTIPIERALQLATTASQLEHILLVDTHESTLEKSVCYLSNRINLSTHCNPTLMDSESPLFTLYTSGSTGKPKGLVHTTAGYLLYAAITHKYVFDYHPGDIYFCTADCGWITGHTYVIYGPLMNAATTVMFGGTPTYPTPSRYWEIVDKHQVNIFYTAPTAIRTLMQAGNQWLESTHRRSLNCLGSVGEPINPEAWRWYYEAIGHSQCPIVDTWWQTETGGIMISPLPGATDMIPGAATQPFLGIKPVLLDLNHNEVDNKGRLAIKYPWPGMARTIYHDASRYNDYFEKGYYMTGDGAMKDKNGNITITGRLDDVLNVSGHRLGSAEIESALVSHPDISEAAVIGLPDRRTGEAIIAFVSIMANKTPSTELTKTLKDTVRAQIGPIATPKTIYTVTALPKTRSGKIMRRLLRKIVSGHAQSLGDLSTLANPDCLHSLQMLCR